MFRLLILASFAIAPSIAQVCSNSTLNGAYAYATDSIATVGGKTITNSQVGRIVFDGAGKFTVRAAVTSGGTTDVGSTSGEYLLGSDCTMTGKTAEGLEFDGVVVNAGSDFFIMVREPGVTSSGGGTKIENQGACSAATLDGSFGYFAEGTITSDAGVSGLGELGVLQFDGRGGVTGVYSASLGGLVERKTYNGKYEVGQDCTANAQFTISGANYLMNFTIASTGNTFVFSIAGGGAVLTGQGSRIFPR